MNFAREILMNSDIFRWSLLDEFPRWKRSSSRRLSRCFLTPMIRLTRRVNCHREVLSMKAFGAKIYQIKDDHVLFIPGFSRVSGTRKFFGYGLTGFHRAAA